VPPLQHRPVPATTETVSARFDALPVLGSTQAYREWLAHPVSQRDWDDTYLINTCATFQTGPRTCVERPGSRAP
jgi:hypothetical protein